MNYEPAPTFSPFRCFFFPPPVIYSPATSAHAVCARNMKRFPWATIADTIDHRWPPDCT